MKIFNLIRSEFIKNYSIKRLLLIVLVMAISVVVLSEGFLFLDGRPYYGPDKDRIEAINNDYQQLLAKEKKNIDDEFELYYYKVELEIDKYIYKNKIEQDWREELINTIFDKLMENKIIEIYRDKPEQINLDVVCNTINISKNFYEYAQILCDNETNIDELESKNKKIIDDYSELLKENKCF